jgi:RNA polymerase sigma factor (sigma-70 family)
MKMIKQEDTAAFVMRLFEAYYERVFAFARKSAPSDIAEDVCQEVFVRLLEHPRLNEMTLSVSYLIKIAHNLLRRRYSRSVRLRQILEYNVQPDLERREGVHRRRTHSPDQPTLDRKQINDAMRDLPEQEREAVWLIVCQGKSYQHAASAMGVNVTTINNWKHRGIDKLKAIAQQEAINPPFCVENA